MDEWEPAPLCADCKTELSGPARDHGQEGFGHFGRCCGCYEKRQRNVSRSAK